MWAWCSSGCAISPSSATQNSDERHCASPPANVQADTSPPHQPKQLCVDDFEDEMDLSSDVIHGSTVISQMQNKYGVGLWRSRRGVCDHHNVLCVHVCLCVHARCWCDHGRVKLLQTASQRAVQACPDPGQPTSRSLAARSRSLSRDVDACQAAASDGEEELGIDDLPTGASTGQDRRDRDVGTEKVVELMIDLHDDIQQAESSLRWSSSRQLAKIAPGTNVIPAEAVRKGFRPMFLSKLG